MDVPQNTMTLTVLCLLYLATTGSAKGSDRDKDQVHALPGLQEQPKFKQFSGYLYAGPTKRLHYMYVESQSKPSRDPLIIWFNGGPGCSSMGGYLTENGPFTLDSKGKTLRPNPYSWNKIGNIMFLESPAGVGYSYDLEGNITVTDDMVAEQNYLAIKAFLKRFPELSHRPMFITGESYAGVYIPTLLMLVKEDPTINFKGAAIGNGLMDNVGLMNSKIYYYSYHGFLGADLWSQLTSACCHDNVCTFVPFPNKECQELVGKVFVDMMKEPVNPYNVNGDCLTYGGALRDDVSRKRRSAILLAFLIKQIKLRFGDQKIQASLTEAVDEAIADAPCEDDSPKDLYMNRQGVRDALHIPGHLPKWASCSGTLRRVYTTQYSDVRKQILSILNDQKYRILLYNGDLDTVCDFFGDEAFVDSLNLEEISPRQPWYYTDEDGTEQIGGFVHQFAGLEYRTVKGSGHMVPTDQPAAAFEMIKTFITSTDN